jgi:heme/copper-type cytochrome/quinol oxidase subunit 2
VYHSWLPLLSPIAFQWEFITSRQKKVNTFYFKISKFKLAIWAKHSLCPICGNFVSVLIKEFILDNVLVAVAYYIGSEKEFTGTFPFTILVCVTVVCMISSEMCAKTRRQKISPASQVKKAKVQKRIISNLIPFTRLNIIFAFSIFVIAMLKVIERTQTGVPKLSIQAVVMQLCLLISNPEAKIHFGRKFSNLTGLKCQAYSKETNKENQITKVQDNKNNILQDELPIFEHPNENFHNDIIDEIPTIHVISCV